MKNLLTAIALFTIVGTGVTTAAEAYCGRCAPARVCRQSPCMARMVRVEMEPVCATCNPCDPCGRGSGIFGILPWNW